MTETRGQTVFESVEAMAAAIADGTCPGGVSPGGAASALGVSRQAVNELVKRGTLRSYRAGRVVLVDMTSIGARLIVQGEAANGRWSKFLGRRTG